MNLYLTEESLKLQQEINSYRVSDWLDASLRSADFQCRNLPFYKSREWEYTTGSIVHKSGQFFSVIGLRWTDATGHLCEQPFIDQREVGTLGFLIREDAGVSGILVQAKIEPGNIGIIQLAPSVQVTMSNGSGIHGGEIAPFVELFNEGDKSIICDLRHSEQGTRFYHKVNRNVLVCAPQNLEFNNWYRWMPVDTILDLIHTDFLFNTDFRSVITSVPWENLVNRLPFSRYLHGYGTELLKSYTQSETCLELDELRQNIADRRQNPLQPIMVSLDKLHGWQIDPSKSRIVCGESLSVRQVYVNTYGREVRNWDQPLFDSSGQGRILLLCGRYKGVLHFLLQAVDEPGLINKTELTATIVIDPGKICRPALVFPKGRIIVQCRQSEEGGRFFKDINLFRIVDTGDVFPAPEGYFWLSLYQIKQLLAEAGWFTNELRSVLSLLLRWM